MSRYLRPCFKRIRRLGALPELTSKRPKAGNDLQNQSRYGRRKQRIKGSSLTTIT